jgi:hypothetical protein
MKYATRRGTAAVEHYAVQPAPRVPHGTLLKVACLDCPAQVGEKCTSATGKVVTAGHKARRRLAICKYIAERGVGR